MFEVFEQCRLRACMHGGSVSCIWKILLICIFRNRPLCQFSRQVPITHLPRRFWHGPNDLPCFQNWYLACISSKLRSEWKENVENQSNFTLELYIISCVPARRKPAYPSNCQDRSMVWVRCKNSWVWVLPGSNDLELNSYNWILVCFIVYVSTR